MPHKETNLKKAAGRRLAQVVIFSGLSKGAFAKWLGHPNQTALSNWLAGLAMPQLPAMLKIKQRWKVSLDWIYDGDGAGQAQNITRQLEAIAVSDEPAPRGRPQRPERPELRVLEGSRDDAKGPKRARQRA